MPEDMVTTDELVEEDAEADRHLVTALRATLLAIYVVDFVIILDILTHGEVRDRARRAWKSFDARFLTPAKRRAEERKAASFVVFEAMCIVEEAAS